MANDMFPSSNYNDNYNNDNSTQIVGMYTANELLGNATPCLAIHKTMEKLVANQPENVFSIVVLNNRKLGGEAASHPFVCVGLGKEGRFTKVLDGDKINVLNTESGFCKVVDFEDMMESEESETVGLSWRN